MPTVAEMKAARTKAASAVKRLDQAIKGQPRPPEALENHAEIARAYGVQQPSVVYWAKQPGFPAKSPSGWWLKPDLDAWLEKNGLGPWAKSQTSLADARMALLVEQAARTALEKRTLERQEQIDLGAVLLADDVAGLHERVAYTAGSVLDTLIDRLDRELPQGLGEETRGRVLEAGRRVVADVRAVIEELIAGDTESTEHGETEGIE